MVQEWEKKRSVQKSGPNLSLNEAIFKSAEVDIENSNAFIMGFPITRDHKVPRVEQTYKKWNADSATMNMIHKLDFE